jgi:hypothetical protein
MGRRLATTGLITAVACACAGGASALQPAARQSAPSRPQRAATVARAPTGYRLLTTMTGRKIPHGALWAGDLGWVSQGRYYFSDDTNAQVDVFNTRTDKYVGAVPGFAGIAPGIPTENDIEVAGPTGVQNVDGDVWAGDGNSTLKVIDPNTLTIIDTISTGGHKRADEFAWDPTDNVVLVGNPSDKPVFASFIDANTRQVTGRLTLPGATGAEQPIWDAHQHLFFLPVPLAKGGELLGVSPTTQKVIKRYPLPKCAPSGVAQGPGQQAVIACATSASIINLNNGRILTRIAKFASGDQVAYDPHVGVYFVAAGFASSPLLGIINAHTRRPIGSVKTTFGAHSVAVDPTNGHVFVPESKGVVVLAPRF